MAHSSKGLVTCNRIGDPDLSAVQTGYSVFLAPSLAGSLGRWYKVVHVG
jgi:hypothetical protein